VSISFLTPLVLLVGLFNGRRRLLHDIILGTVVINSSVRTQVAQPARTSDSLRCRLTAGNRLTGAALAFRGAMLAVDLLRRPDDIP
jgi:hypothetical protein